MTPLGVIDWHAQFELYFSTYEPPSRTPLLEHPSQLLGLLIATLSCLLVALMARNQLLHSAASLRRLAQRKVSKFRIHSERGNVSKYCNDTIQITQQNRMAKESTRSRLTGEEVLALLDEEEEDGMEDTFFPGSDNDFGLSSDDEGTVAREDRWEY